MGTPDRGSKLFLCRAPQRRIDDEHQNQPRPCPERCPAPTRRHTRPHRQPDHHPVRSPACFRALRAPLLSLSPDDLAALDRAAQRVEELNRHVMKEIGELHVEILKRVDLRRVQFPAWEVMSEFIFYSLFRAVELPSGSLEREKNPALALKMLAGALGNR